MYIVMVKSTVEISQTFVAFSEYMNFTIMYLNSNAYFVVSYADLCVSENELAFFPFVSSTAIFQRI